MKYFFYFIAIVLIGCNQTTETTDTAPLLINISNMDWLPDREDVIAGTIMVPENHDKVEGKKIQISYVILKAKDTSSVAYPMIRFSGGPGGKSLGLGVVNYMLEQPAREKRDIILFDQRGIGYSSALPDMSVGIFDIMASDANEEEELAMMTELILEYKKKCQEQSINPEYYNTFQNAKDVGMLFQHLGYDKYNLMGGSYGTRLGRVVQDMFPDYINSSVFDSPAPLSGDFLINRLDSYSLALGRVFNYCENNLKCKSQYPKLKEEYIKAIVILKESPLEVIMNDSVKVVINAQDGIYLLRRLLYQSNSREKAPELIRAFLESGGQAINEVLQSEYQLTSAINISMLLSVEKYEQFNPINSAQVIKEYYRKYPLLPVKLGFFDAFYQAGRNWHSASLPMEERKFQESDIPTLILVNQFDPVTPPRNGHLFKEKLSNSILLILDEGGHGGGNQQCKEKVINDFMNEPNAILETFCLNIYQD